MEKLQHIVIIGGGFAGLNLAKELDKNKFRVTILDKNNFHSFPPLFYQIASSGLEPSSISFPFRREMRRLKNTNYHFGEVLEIDSKNSTVRTQFETIKYDQLVIASGTTNNFFNQPELKEKCTRSNPPLRLYACATKFSTDLNALASPPTANADANY